MQADITIIGGGIVGISAAYQLQKLTPNKKIILIEKENALAKHQTGNNSGVIHSGIYYKPGSLKATNCKTGYDLLINFCNEHNIPYELCGKVIVATNENELGSLEKLFERGIANGLNGIKYISAEEIKMYEPYCTGIKGIYVPQTGIVNYTVVCNKMADLFSTSGGQILLNSKVLKIENAAHGIEISTEKNTIISKLIINCAGLYCDKIAEMAGEKLNVKIIPFRGEYFELKNEKSYLVNNLIYPVPDANFPFLGVHFTRRISGEIEAGPNAVFAFKREGYTKTSFKWREFWESIFWRGFRKVALKYWKTGIGEYYRSYNKNAFTKALQKLIPTVQKKDLIPAGAGVRAQACDKDGNLIDDFYIQENNNCIHVLNAPSPAATSSLSIGKTVAEIAIKKYSLGYEP